MKITWYDIRGLFILWFAYRTSLARQILFFRSNIKKDKIHLEYAIGSGLLYNIVSFNNKPKEAYATELANNISTKLAKRTKTFIYESHEITNTIPQVDTCNIANALHCFDKPKLELVRINERMRLGGTLAMTIKLYAPENSVSDKIDKYGMKIGILKSPLHQLGVEHLLKSSGFKITYCKKHGYCLYVKAVKVS